MHNQVFLFLSDLLFLPSVIIVKVMSHPFMSVSHDGDLGCFVRNIILNSVFQKGQFIIPDIADQTGFSVTTIAKYVSELYAKDILEKPNFRMTSAMV